MIWLDCTFFLYENCPVSGLHVAVHTSELGVWQRPNKLLAGGRGTHLKRAVNKPIELELTGISKTGYSRMMTGMITGSHSISPKNTCQLVNKIWTGLSHIKTAHDYCITTLIIILFYSRFKFVRMHIESKTIVKKNLMNHC